MKNTISGTFEVKMQPLETVHDQPNLGRMRLDKTFSGPLSGESKGEMLTAMTSVQSSAGYVAIENFSGVLEGKKGTFALQHFGIMHDGKDRLTLEVVPNSGTNELENISGTMEIIRQEKGHEYVLHFEL